MDTASLWIGDAVDEIRSWFGYQPAGGLSALGIAPQLLSAAWLAGIVAVAYGLNKSIRVILISVEASKLQRQTPALSRDAALDIAQQRLTAGSLFGLPNLGIIALVTFGAWYFLSRK